MFEVSPEKCSPGDPVANNPTVFRGGKSGLTALRRATRIFCLPKGFLTNLKWQAASTTLQSVFGGLYQLFLGRYFGVTGFGIYGLATSFVSLCFLCTDFRTHELIVHYICPQAPDFRPEAAVRAWRNISVLDFWSRLLAFALALILAKWFSDHVIGDSRQIGIVFLCSLSFASSKLLNGPAIGILRILDKFHAIAVFSGVEWFLKLVTLGAAVAVANPSLADAILIAIVISASSNLAQVLTAVHFWRKRYPSSLRAACRRSSDADLKLNWKYVLSNLGVSIADLPVKELDVSLAGVFLSLDSVGCYKMAKQLVWLIWRALDPILLVLMPEFRKAFEAGDPPALRSFVKRLSALLFFGGLTLTAIASGVVFLFGSRLLGQDFRRATLIFPVISSWILIAAPLLWVYPFMSALGRSDISFKGNLSGNILGIIVFILLTWSLGIFGAAMGLSIALSMGFLSTAALASQDALIRQKFSS